MSETTSLAIAGAATDDTAFLEKWGAHSRAAREAYEVAAAKAETAMAEHKGRLATIDAETYDFPHEAIDALQINAIRKFALKTLVTAASVSQDKFNELPDEYKNLGQFMLVALKARPTLASAVVLATNVNPVAVERDMVELVWHLIRILRLSVNHTKNSHLVSKESFKIIPVNSCTITFNIDKREDTIYGISLPVNGELSLYDITVGAFSALGAEDYRAWILGTLNSDPVTAELLHWLFNEQLDHDKPLATAEEFANELIRAQKRKIEFDSVDPQALAVPSPATHPALFIEYPDLGNKRFDQLKEAFAAAAYRVCLEKLREGGANPDDLEGTHVLRPLTGRTDGYIAHTVVKDLKAAQLGSWERALPYVFILLQRSKEIAEAQARLDHEPNEAVLDVYRGYVAARTLRTVGQTLLRYADADNPSKQAEGLSYLAAAQGLSELLAASIPDIATQLALDSLDLSTGELHRAIAAVVKLTHEALGSDTKLLLAGLTTEAELQEATAAEMAVFKA